MTKAKREFRLHDGMTGAAITVRVTPRASKNEIYEILDDGTIKIRLTAPPVEGKANQALIDFLSEVLDVPKSSLEIVAGETGRDKIVTILNLDAPTVQARILQHLS
ncbi:MULTISPECIES: DUF167 domain-containing protein [Anaerolinea]|uniref:DUF167 domain-containing protein n=1 Tax=Anaerolinea TaxID=233189 RepID=UPI00261F2DAD|nr:DUF167 domain-containing protein [Anaerolinea thermophila]